MKYRIKQLREQNGMRQYEVAELLNLSPANYGKIENEQVTLTFDIAINIAKIFKCSLNEIAGLPDDYGLEGYTKFEEKNVKIIMFIKKLDEK